MSRDYTPLLSLFQEDGTLTLTHGMKISEAARRQLEEVIDDAISSPLAAISGGRAVEMVNHDEYFDQSTPFVHIVVEEEEKILGTLTLQACVLRLVSFHEVIERLKDAFETFELFLFQEQIPFHRALRRNLSVWQNVNAALIGKYRAWLPRYFADDKQQDKLQAARFYCQLAAKEDYLSEDALDAINEAIHKPLPRRSKKSARSKRG